MAFTEMIDSTRKQAVDTLVETQERIVEFNKTVADQFASVASRIPVPEFANELWGPDAIEKWFSFSAELLEANRKFATALVSAWAKPVDAQ